MLIEGECDMSIYRENEKKDENRNFTFKDSQEIKKLLKSKKLTDKQRIALDHLLYSYNYMTD